MKDATFNPEHGRESNDYFACRVCCKPVHDDGDGICEGCEKVQAEVVAEDAQNEAEWLANHPNGEDNG